MCPSLVAKNDRPVTLSATLLRYVKSSGPGFEGLSTRLSRYSVLRSNPGDVVSAGTDPSAKELTRKVRQRASNMSAPPTERLHSILGAASLRIARLASVATLTERGTGAPERIFSTLLIVAEQSPFAFRIPPPAYLACAWTSNRTCGSLAE